MNKLTTTRRSFLKTSSLALLGSPWLLNSLPVPKKYKWGIILNTVRHEMTQNIRGTLSQLARMGYRYVEGNYYGESAAKYAEVLKDVGLKCIVGGSSMSSLQKDMRTWLETAETLEYKYITCYWPWLTSAENLTYDECMETAQRLNEVGRQVKAAGFRFTWHNHDKEFIEIREKTAFELLIENTDPDWVGVQMDLYWVRKGGANPLDLFEKYPGRFELFHVKDMDDTEEEEITCVGEGQIDFQEIFDHAKHAGMEYAMVEHEDTEEGKGIDCARTSIKHLDTIR